MNQELFRLKLRDYCRQTGNLQKALAQELGLNYSVLSNKLNGTSNARLNQPEIKQIVRTLLGWNAFSSQSQVIEFLELAGLSSAAFSPEEWKSSPLKELTISSPSTPPNVKNSEPPPLAKPLPPVEELSGVVGLSVPPAPLIGREAEIKTILELLSQKNTRLVTLQGPGGIGKTRLASEVALQSVSNFPDGVFFVKLAPVSDPLLVIPTIAQHLTVREQQGQAALATLKTFLRDKKILIVLDNFEQIVKAAEHVGELLEAAPNLKILVTTRILLRLEGEQVFEVPTLALPDLSQLQTNESDSEKWLLALSDNAAVKLFLQHSHSLRSNFKLTTENALAVAQICLQLNGLPLAIELATSRLKILSPQALLARLGDSEALNVQDSRLLKLLVGGPQNLPARQQTIRQTLDWSYSLLEPDEKTLFARLAIFPGGCTLEAIEEICNLQSDYEADTLSNLEQLVDKSMLRSRTETNGEIRFVMLQMLREYALEKLALDPTTKDILYDRHAVYFLNVAEDAANSLHGPEHAQWVSRLEAERHNMRLALTWLVEQAEKNKTAAELAGRMVVALYRFWWLNNYYTEGRGWLEKVMNFRDQLSKRTLAKLYHAVGQIQWDQGERAEAIATYQQSLAFWRELQDKKGICGVLDGLGYALNKQGQTAKALEYHRESLAIWRELGDQRNIAMSLYNQGVAEQQQTNHAAARTFFEEALELFLATKDIWGLELALMRISHLSDTIPDSDKIKEFYEDNLLHCRKYEDWRGIAISSRALGLLAARQQQHAKAVGFYEEALVLFRRLSDTRATIRTLYFYGWEKLFLSDYDTALELFAEMMESHRLLEDKCAVAVTVVGLAVGLAKKRRLELAARLFGAVQTLLNETRLPLISEINASYERAFKCVQSRLDAETFAYEYNKGLVGEAVQIPGWLSDEQEKASQIR